MPPKKRTRGAVNKAFIQALDKAEQITLAAQKTAHATALATRDITAEFVTTLQDDIKTARNEIANYVESVEKAADSLRDYIASNSLGTGSFFADFFKSFGKGLISGAINVSSGKGTDMSEAKDSLKALRDSVLSSLKDELASGKDTLKNALHDTATSFLEQAITKATEAAKRAVDDLTKTKNKAVEETAN